MNSKCNFKTLSPPNTVLDQYLFPFYLATRAAGKTAFWQFFQLTYCGVCRQTELHSDGWRARRC